MVGIASAATQDAIELGFLRRVRQAMHRRPELSHAEVRTAAFVERLLRLFGLQPFRPAPTSVAVVVGAGTNRPRTGFRADLDALPLDETTGRVYASRNQGVAHSCGHDGHAALLLGLARRLSADPPIERVQQVWQQGEEADPSGAPLVIDGLPADLRAEEMFAYHLWPELPSGTIGIHAGPVLASVAGLVVKARGESGRLHGTECEADAADALRAGVEFYRAVAARWSGRHPSPGQPATVTIGQMFGGSAPNRVPLECTLTGTVRASTWSDERSAVATLREIGVQTAIRSGNAVIDVAVRSGIRPPVVNDHASARRASAAADPAGVTWCDYPSSPVGVSDDFGWFLDQSPGALLYLGCGAAGSTDLHDPAFDFDEAALLPAVEIAERIARGTSR